MEGRIRTRIDQPLAVLRLVADAAGAGVVDAAEAEAVARVREIDHGYFSGLLVWLAQC